MIFKMTTKNTLLIKMLHLVSKCYIPTVLKIYLYLWEFYFDESPDNPYIWNTVAIKFRCLHYIEIDH